MTIVTSHRRGDGERAAVRGGRGRRVVQPGLRGVLQPQKRHVDPPPHDHVHGEELRRSGCRHVTQEVKSRDFSKSKVWESRDFLFCVDFHRF